VAGSTQAEAHVMQQTARKFEQVNADLQTMLSQLMNELSHLSGAWKGRGAQAFEQVKLQYQNDLKALNQALAETAQSIAASGVGYDTTDDSAASKVSNSGGSFNLPL
jgi:ESAT-6 family protein